MRAFLNGETLYLDDGTTSDKYKVSNFLNMAFTSSAQTKLLTTVVKNDGNSSNDPTNTGWSRIDLTSGNDSAGNPLSNPSKGKINYSGPDTQDKVFALSIYDCCNKNYGVAGGGDGQSTKLNRNVTEYSKAFELYSDGNGVGYYMTRTPYYKNDDRIRYVEIGHCYMNEAVNNATLGIVPAIVIEPLN